MSSANNIADKLLQLIQKHKNNINACIARHSYTGNKVDVSQDILNITSKPQGQVCTMLRRPTGLTHTASSPWTVPEENTILNNGDGIVKYSVPNSRLPVIVGGVILGYIEPIPLDAQIHQRYINYYFTAGKNQTVQIGQGFELVCSGFSYGDFVPKNNCIMEIVIKTKHDNDAVCIEIHQVLVRYINP